MFDEPELHIVKFPEPSEDWRAERDRQREEGRRRYLDSLVGLLATLDLSRDLERCAEAILDHLFVVRHLDGDDECHCSCHPRLPDGDFHDYGFSCVCRRTEAERRAHFDSWWAEIDAYWESSEGMAMTARRQAEEDQLIAWLAGHPDVAVKSYGGLCPEQWWGTVAGHSFYFRERHDHWRIELDLRPSGHFYKAWKGGDLDDEDSFESKESEEGDVIAEGTTSDPRYGQTPVQRIEFITDTIRVHLGQQVCEVHTGERVRLERLLRRPISWCPACGTRL